MGRKTQDLTGQRFGRLVVLSRIPRALGASGQAKWLCQCDCGKKTPAGSNALRSGATRSCGCLLREITITRSTTHGLTPRTGRPAPRAYNSWASMIHRCTDPDHPRYPDWGGRGVTVCERWRDFASFLADMGERPEGTTLDRIDSNGNYEPGNCRWATPHEQQVNSRNFKLTPDVVAEVKRLRATRLTLAAIGRQLDLHPSTVSRALSGEGRSRKQG